MIENISHFYVPGFKVLRNTPTDQPKKIGGQIDHYNLHLSISATLRPLSGSEVVSADKMTLIGTHTLYCAVCDVLETDRIEDPEGNQYDIKFVQNVMSMNNHLQISLELRR